ncbi:MAG: hypothetical protein QOK44_1766 [Betaproteobacteria bacterium]|nr:hypothetical protein [Betaproteobacteria bacterium]
MKRIVLFVVLIVVFVWVVVPVGKFLYEVWSMPPGNRYTTVIPKDDVSDIVSVPKPTVDFIAVMASIRQDCSISELVERDDLLSVDFEQLGQAIRRFSLRAKGPKCLATLGDLNGGVTRFSTYERFDPDMYAEPKNLHFTFVLRDQIAESCLPNDSIWEVTKTDLKKPDFIVHLRRLDDLSQHEGLMISTYRGWKGTVMAKKDGWLHPLACK